MKITPRWFQAIGTLVVLQIVLGLLVSEGLLGVVSHVVLGFVILLAAGATPIVSMASRPRPGTVAAAAAVLAVLVVLQASLGLAMLGGDSALLSAAHVVNALAIVVTTFACFFLARRWKSGIVA